MLYLFVGFEKLDLFSCYIVLDFFSVLRTIFSCLLGWLLARFWRIFSLVIKFGVDSCFQTLEKCVTSFWFHDLWWEICHFSVFCCIGMVPFLSCIFQDLVLSFQELDYDMYWYGLLGVYPIWGLLGSLNTWIYIVCQIGKFKPSLFSCTLLLFDILVTWMLDPLLQPHKSLRLCLVFAKSITLLV